MEENDQHDAVLSPRITKFEIALQINTGNTIYQEFADGEEALQFIQSYLRNPRAILEKITPRKRSDEGKPRNND